MATVQTGLVRLNPSNKLIIGYDDLRTRVLEYMETSLRAKVVAEYPYPGTLGDERVGLSESLASSVYKLEIASPTTATGTAAGRMLSFDRGASDRLGKILACPYPRGGGLTYHVGLKHQVMPTYIASSGGLLHLCREELTYGERGTADSVTDNGDGTMTFDITTLMTEASGGPWTSSASAYRRVHIWMVSPEDAGLGIASDLQAKSDGANVTVEVAHAFGQASPSETAADYVVLVEGLTISETDLSAETDADGNLEYWYLGSVTDGVIDYSGQLLIETFGSLAYGLGFLEDELSKYFKVALNAPAIYIPDAGDTEAWQQSMSHSTTSPSTETFVWDPLPAGTSILTADAAGRVRVVSELQSDEIEFDHDEATGTYAIFVVATDVDGAEGVEDVQGVLTYATDAEYAANYPYCLKLMEFDWNTGTNSTTSETLADLLRVGRPSPDSRPDLVLGRGEGGAVGIVEVDEVGSRAAMRLSLYNAADRTDGGEEAVMMRLRRVAGTSRELSVYGPQGEDDGAGSGDFAGAEFVKIEIGGLHDWSVKADADQIYVGTPEYPSSANYLHLLKAGGAQEDTSLGVKPLVKVPDLALIGSAGKIVERACQFDHPNSAGSGWTCNGHRWTVTAAGVDLYFEAPFHRVGEKLIGFRIIGWVVGTDSGDAISATIVRSDCDNASSGWTAETLTGAVTWTYGSEATPTSKTVTLAAEVAGATTDRWALKLLTGFQVAGPGNFYVSSVVARYRVVGI